MHEPKHVYALHHGLQVAGDGVALHTGQPWQSSCSELHVYALHQLAQKLPEETLSQTVQPVHSAFSHVFGLHQEAHGSGGNGGGNGGGAGIGGFSQLCGTPWQPT